MDLQYLLENANRFAYEYRKHFEGDEMPVRHFVADKGIVIITTEKLCIFYFDRVIRYKDDKLINTQVRILNNNMYKIVIQDYVFEIELANVEEATQFEKYYQKYKH